MNIDEQLQYFMRTYVWLELESRKKKISRRRAAEIQLRVAHLRREINQFCFRHDIA